MTDAEFWLEVRRGLITIGKAIARRYGWHGLVVLLGCKEGG
jgi:hypothetical protein